MPQWYRVYFNRMSEAPQCWSVDQGSTDSEINVQGILCQDVVVDSQVDLSTPGTHPTEPRAWFNVYGVMRIDCVGFAVFTQE